jgi:hypothetical protein
MAGFDRPAKRGAWRQQAALAHHFIQCPRPHPFGQRFQGFRRLEQGFGFGRFLAHDGILPTRASCLTGSKKAANRNPPP